MRRLARIFSVFTLVALIAAGALLWLAPNQFPWIERPPAPDAGLDPQLTAPLSGNIDRILVEKSARRITLLQNGAPVRIWPIALGFTPAGDKEREGDGKTPEGIFRIDRLNDRSAYHLSLGLDYPQAEDRARAKAGGYSPGGDIMIHGQPNGLPEAVQVKGDWTAGCIALTNAQMREIWPHVKIGTLVEVRP